VGTPTDNENITTMAGKNIKTFDLKNSNKNNIEINGGQLAAGSYIYSLVLEGVLIDSKQMILTSK